MCSLAPYKGDVKRNTRKTIWNRAKDSGARTLCTLDVSKTCGLSGNAVVEFPGCGVGKVGLVESLDAQLDKYVTPTPAPFASTPV